MYRTIALAALLSLASHATWAGHQPAAMRTVRTPHAYSTTAIDRYLQSEMHRQNIPGMSLAVVKNGKPIYIKSY